MSQLIIETDTSKSGWGRWVVVSKGFITGSSVISRKNKACQFTGIYCRETCNSSPYQGKISDCFVFLSRMELLQVSEEIWDYLVANRIAMTAGYLESILNV